MSTLSSLIDAWDEGHREFAIAMEGLSDEDLWKRAHPKLLSVGELAGHVAYWQGVWILGEGNDKAEIDKLPIQSPLLNPAFRYYTSSVGEAFQLDLTAQQVLDELMHVHKAAKAHVFEKDKDDPVSSQWGTWGNIVQYQAFHVAYHTGQVYSVRHLMGHETEDN